MTSGRTNNFPESGRGLCHVTPTIFGSTVGYPSDSLASCSFKAKGACDEYKIFRYILRVSYNKRNHGIRQLCVWRHKPVMTRLFRATVATCRCNNANTASANARMSLDWPIALRDKWP